MNIKIFVSLLFLATVLADTEFSKFQSNFGKKYSPKEILKRKAIFQANLKEIAEHNEKYLQGKVSYSKKIDRFTDMTPEEIASEINGLPPVPSHAKNDQFSENMRQFLNKQKIEPLDSFSWVDEGIVTSPKNQGNCGSCTAFAVTGSLESCYIRKSGEFVDDLSEQFLVDCAYNYDEGGFGAYGCDGAWPQAYFAYIKKETGGRDQTEESYPYRGIYQGYCYAQENGYYSNGVMIDSINYWGTNEDELMNLVRTYGPVVTTLDASSLSGYNNGVIDSYYCCEASVYGESCTSKNNHAVLVVGFGSEGGKDYWLVKNSWGSNFGQDGFFKIKRGTGHCGFGWQINSVPIC